MTRVLTFGTFDGFDLGHQQLIRAAAQQGSELVVAVARDQHVRELKHKEPKNTENVRLEVIRSQKDVSRAYLSDTQLGSYQIIDNVHPDVIALGFDQFALKADLERWMAENGRSIPIILLPQFPE